MNQLDFAIIGFFIKLQSSKLNTDCGVFVNKILHIYVLYTQVLIILHCLLLKIKCFLYQWSFLVFIVSNKVVYVQKVFVFLLLNTEIKSMIYLCLFFLFKCNYFK